MLRSTPAQLELFFPSIALFHGGAKSIKKVLLFSPCTYCMEEKVKAWELGGERVCMKHIRKKQKKQKKYSGHNTKITYN